MLWEKKPQSPAYAVSAAGTPENFVYWEVTTRSLKKHGLVVFGLKSGQPPGISVKAVSASALPLGTAEVSIPGPGRKQVEARSPSLEVRGGGYPVSGSQRRQVPHLWKPPVRSSLWKARPLLCREQAWCS